MALLSCDVIDGVGGRFELSAEGAKRKDRKHTYIQDIFVIIQYTFMYYIIIVA